MKIGIIGKGFVGSAVEYGFSCNPKYKAIIKIYDKNPTRSLHSLDETVNESDVIFLSLPTPANLDGTINLDIIENSLEEISICNKKNDNIILIRSTIIPGTCKIFTKKFKNLNIVFNPEFLTEKNANDDFLNQARIIIGGDKILTKKVANIYKWRFGKSINIIETNFETAELIKYMSNCFLATKVSFMNEMKILSDKLGAEWDQTVKGFIADPRIGDSHTNVPGLDGKLGFGGSCFPKDLQAIINFAKSMDIDMHTLEGVWKTNLEIRPEKDWEKLEGRAITKKVQ